MARSKSSSKTLKRQIKDGKTSIVEVISNSAVRTKVYEIQDPSERLVAVVGASMFNEPRFYPIKPVERRDKDGAIIGFTYNEEDLDGQAKLIIETAMQIAESGSPKDLVQIAHWARTELRMRTTPQVLLAVAAHCPATKEYVRDYCTKVIQRADEIKQVFAAYRHLFGTGAAFPNCLKKGLAASFQKFGEAQLLKYNSKDRPNFADVLKMVDRHKNYPLNKSMDHYLKTGEILDAEEIPVVTARKELLKQDFFEKEAQILAKKSQANWEVLKSAFPGDSKRVWEWLIDANQIPYMAMMRNLRNFIEADLDSNRIKKVCSRLVEHAKTSKQLPYRYIAARDAVAGRFSNPNLRGYSHHGRGKPRADSHNQKLLFDALGSAADTTIADLQKLPGTTLVAVDTSGSMDSEVSGKSKMRCVDAAAILGGMTIKLSAEGSVCGAFADTFKPVPINPNDTVIDIADKIATIQVGGGTAAEDVLRWAIGNKKKFDRIIIFSDMQTYNSNGFLWRHRSSDTVEKLIKYYRKNINKDCKLHCFDIHGSGTSLTPQGDTQSNLVAGFSEQLLKQVLEFEGLTSKDGEQVFTIEYIREKF